MKDELEYSIGAEAPPNQQREREKDRTARDKEDQYHEKARQQWREEMQLRPPQSPMQPQQYLHEIYHTEMSNYIKSKHDQLDDAIRKHLGFLDEHVRNYCKRVSKPDKFIDEYNKHLSM